MARDFSVFFLLAAAISLLPSAVNAAEPRGQAPGIERADPLELGVRAGAVEIVGARRERFKRFRLPDGRTFGEVVTARPLHYRDENGAWRESAAKLEARGQDVVADTLPFSVRASGEGIAIGSRDEKAGIVLLTGARASATGEKLSGRPPGAALDWQWEVSESEVKLTSAPVVSSRG